MSDTIDFVDYVIERFKQIGSTRIFGVPGDFFLNALDHLEAEKDLEWVGNASELGAAYAADGYARVKGVPGILMTTFGAGDFSALNGVAGCMGESIPILSIVGAPARKVQAALTSKGIASHHHLHGYNPNEVHTSMIRPAVCSEALLSGMDESEWVEAFDRVLQDVLVRCEPGYLQISEDAWVVKVSGKGLETRLPVCSASPFQSGSSPSQEAKEAIDAIVNRVKKAEDTIMLVDHYVGRFGLTDEVSKLATTCGFRAYTSHLMRSRLIKGGKSHIDESLPNYHGTLLSTAAMLGQGKDRFQDPDLVLYLGPLKSDYNTSFAKGLPDPSVSPSICLLGVAHLAKKTIEIQQFATVIGEKTYSVGLRKVLPHLAEAIKRSQPARLVEQSAQNFQIKTAVTQLNHESLWPRMAEWLIEGDIVVVETGTGLFGLLDFRLPKSSKYLVQPHWLSLGWANGAACGAAIAASEMSPSRRTILFAGDGGLQLNFTEIGTMLKVGVFPYIFVLNNDGYDVERLINGEKARYNGIQAYDHQLILPMFAGRKCSTPYESLLVESVSDLEKLLADEKFAIPDKIRLIELRLPRMDSPLTRTRLMESLAPIKTTKT